MSDKKNQSSSEINFETFILSLGTAVIISLGEVENPVSGKKEKNLPSAKQHIDILEILSLKTAGNLTAQEKKLLDEILYETRLKYIQQTS
ncbi:MAG: DUF1844 domain-containing protein [Deltaproteobacteria bacterium]|nr:DUF1844 domain-containing protein [Deltaproteobacteria bacterium]